VTAPPDGSAAMRSIRDRVPNLDAQAGSHAPGHGASIIVTPYGEIGASVIRQRALSRRYGCRVPGSPAEPTMLP
jgi:hypothetical protein